MGGIVPFANTKDQAQSGRVWWGAVERPVSRICLSSLQIVLACPRLVVLVQCGYIASVGVSARISCLGELNMSYSDFVSLFALDNNRGPEELLAQKPLSFPLTTNERGDALTKSLQQWSNVGFAGKRILDVGCSYGGLSIALAKAGASVVGIDPSAKLVAYADANGYGQSDVAFAHLDPASIAVREKYTAGSFDLIFLNDVLERHYDVDALIANLDYLLAPAGMIYFRTANNNSTKFILSEGHRKIFGLLLMDPDCWFFFDQKRASIYYRSLNTYLALFKFYNMPKHALIDDDRIFNRFSERRLSRQIKDIFSMARRLEMPNPVVQQILRKQTVKLRDRYMYDRQMHGEEFIKFKYGSTSFSGFVGRPDATIALRTPTVELPEFGVVGRAMEAPAEEQDTAA